MKKLFSLLAVAALSMSIFASSAMAANDEPGGGTGWYRHCDPVTHIQWEYSNGWWKPVGQC